MCKGVLGNDQNHASDVAWEYPISFDQYLKVITTDIYQRSNREWTPVYNCTHFANGVLNDAGIYNPFPTSCFPSDLAKYMKDNNPGGGVKLTPISSKPNVCK